MKTFILWQLALGTILLIATAATAAYGARGYESTSVIFGLIAAVAFVGFIIGDEEL